MIDGDGGIGRGGSAVVGTAADTLNKAFFFGDSLMGQKEEQKRVSQQDSMLL